MVTRPGITDDGGEPVHPGQLAWLPCQRCGDLQETTFVDHVRRANRCPACAAEMAHRPTAPRKGARKGAQSARRPTPVRPADGHTGPNPGHLP